MSVKSLKNYSTELISLAYGILASPLLPTVPNLRFPQLPRGAARCFATEQHSIASMSSSSHKEELPYALKQLNWDQMHHFNSQDTYGYKGEPRLLSDAMLQCDMCEQWFFLSEVGCVPKDAKPFVPFQRNYRFSCRICTGGTEQFELQQNTWTSIALTAIYNLLLSDDGTSLKAGVWLKVKNVVSWVQSHWGGLTSGRHQSQLLENSAISKCLLYTQVMACLCLPLIPLLTTEIHCLPLLTTAYH